VFFDHAGIQWEYEKQGFVLDDVPYLPDFWLPEAKMSLEVKGDEILPEEKKLCAAGQRNWVLMYHSQGLAKQRRRSLSVLP